MGCGARPPYTCVCGGMAACVAPMRTSLLHGHVYMHARLHASRLVRGEDTPVEERITVEPYARATKKPRTAEEEAADDSAAAQALARTRAVLAGKLGSGKAKKGEEEGEEEDGGRDGRDFDARMRSKMMDQRVRMGDVDEAKEAERAAARAARAGSEGAGREGAEKGGDDEGEREEASGARGARSAKEAAASRREELEETRREKRAYGKVQAGAVEVRQTGCFFGLVGDAIQHVRGTTPLTMNLKLLCYNGAIVSGIIQAWFKSPWSLFSPIVCLC